MPKVCSVSLSPEHVYACLVCGKYYEGRGRSTHAFTHAVEAGHHVFMHTGDGRVWCLPDGYEVVDESLKDIQYALAPTFPPAAIAGLDGSVALARDVAGVPYLPGFLGMNNLGGTDGMAAVVHALAHVPPLRDYFLEPANYAAVAAPLVHRFGDLVRRLWSPAAFKATLSPIEFMTEVSVASRRRFTVGTPVDAADFLTWLLNTLHAALVAPDAGRVAAAAASAASAAATEGAAAAATAAAGVKRARAAAGAGASIITDTFQGELEVTTLSSELDDARAREGGDAPTYPRVSHTPFFFLALDLPPAPLFTDATGANVIPQVALYTLLGKYDGEYVSDTLRGQYHERKRYRVTRLPPYVIMTLRRFARNAFFSEKNPTLLTFPVKNLELRPYVGVAAGAGDEHGTPLPRDGAVADLSVADLKALLRRLGAPLRHSDGVLERRQLVAAAAAALAAASGTKYDLVSSIVHDDPPTTDKGSKEADPLATGSYRVAVQHAASAQWYEVQDLRVQETQPQMIGISEAFIVVYRRQAPPPAAAAAAAAAATPAGSA